MSVEQVERLMQAAGLKWINQIAELLNVHPNAVSNWKTRGIPARQLVEAANILCVSSAWLETGVGSMRPWEAIGDLGSLTEQEIRLVKCFRRCTEKIKSETMEYVIDGLHRSLEERRE